MAWKKKPKTVLESKDAIKAKINREAKVIQKDLQENSEIKALTKALEPSTFPLNAGQTVRETKSLGADEPVDTIAEKAFVSEPAKGIIGSTEYRFENVESIANIIQDVMRCDNPDHVSLVTQSFFKTDDKEICLCVPAYKSVNPLTMVSLFATALQFGKDRIGMHFEFGDAVIENARNKIAAKALEDDYEWLMWIDDDIIPPFGRSDLTRRWANVPETYQEVADVHFLSRLLSHGHSVVGGLYFGRSRTGRPMYAEACVEDSYMENRAARDPDFSQLRETQWVATGCLLTHRSVFEDIQTKFPELAPQEFEYKDEATGESIRYKQEVWDYFRKYPGCGEDVSFCRRARAAGHKVYVDHMVKCLHAGGNAWGYHNTSGGMA